MRLINSNPLLTSLCFVLLVIVSCATVGYADNAPLLASSVVVWPAIKSAIKKTPEVEDTVAGLVAKMSVEEKVGQLIQPGIKDITPEQVTKYHIGSVLNGGGMYPDNNKNASVADWAALADTFYHASMDSSGGRTPIPIMWGTDAVHGHNNVIGATLFPHNIGLGAARDPELLHRIGAATAREVAATGLDWTFAPTVTVVRNDRWGRTYEGYSEHPQIVREYAGKMVEGLQGARGKDLFSGDKTLATAKHFIGDGGTRGGQDRGDTPVSEEELRDIHAPGYFTALEAGVQTIMASFNSWQGDRLHGHHYLLTEVLKGQMGFDGLVVGDWNGHGFVPGCTNSSCAPAINAGVDILMAPSDWEELYHNTLAQVTSGEITLARLDDAVTRILRVKIRAGLFEKGAPSTREFAGKPGVLGSPEHRAIAREAVRKSLVLLKNNGGILPLERRQKVLVAGDGANDIGKQSGGWSITWQGTDTTREDFPAADSIFEGIRDAVEGAGGTATLSEDGAFDDRPDVAIVVFGEDPYAEWHGDVASLAYSEARPEDLEILKRLKAQGIPVVSLFLSGRPLWVNSELNSSNAFVAAWLPGSEGAGIADVIFKDASGRVNHDFSGKLSFSWPRDPSQTTLNYQDADYDPLFAYGFGLSYRDQVELADNLPEVVKVDHGSQLKPVWLFMWRAVKPWQLFVRSEDNPAVAFSGKVVTTEGAPDVTMQVLDKDMQEDALSISWQGRVHGEAFLQAETPQDLSQYLEQDAALAFVVRVDRKPTAGVEMRIDCGKDCSARLELNKLLDELPQGTWQDVYVDLRCLTDAGADFSKVTRPLVIATAGELEIGIANIQIGAGSDYQKGIRCVPAGG